MTADAGSGSMEVEAGHRPCCEEEVERREEEEEGRVLVGMEGGGLCETEWRVEEEEVVAGG